MLKFIKVVNYFDLLSGIEMLPGCNYFIFIIIIIKAVKGVTENPHCIKTPKTLTATECSEGFDSKSSFPHRRQEINQYLCFKENPGRAGAPEVFIQLE